MRLRVLATLLVLVIPSEVEACSYVRVGTDPDVIGRSMELTGTGGTSRSQQAGRGLRWHVNQHRRGGTELPSRDVCHAFAEDLAPSWKNTFGFVSVGALGNTLIVDGMNEAGLTVSAHTLRQSQYQEPAPSTEDGADGITLCYSDLVRWSLGQASSVQDVLAVLGADATRIVGSARAPGEARFHWAFDDAHGGHIILEVLDGQLQIHNNTIGVMTNDPEYRWHLRNLNNNVFLSSSWPTSHGIGIESEIGVIPQVIGHGYNLGGIPGDSSPPSRFTRLFYLREFALRNQPLLKGNRKDDVEARKNASITMAAGLLSNVHIVKGSVASSPGVASSHVLEYTMYNVLKIPQTREFLYRDYVNSRWRRLNLTALNWNRSVSMAMNPNGDSGIQDVTRDFNARE